MLVSISCRAAATGGGAAAFLRSGAGSRALSLGGAFVSYDADPASVYWNPGSCGRAVNSSVCAMYSFLSNERAQGFLSLVFPVSGTGVFGISMLNFSVGGIEKREIDTSFFSEISSSEYCFIGTYALKTAPYFSAGINLKHIRTFIDNYGSYGFSADAGALLGPFYGLRAGIMLQDFAGAIKWSTGTVEDIPFVFRAGLSYYPEKSGLTVSFDAEQNEFEGFYLKGGMEGNVNNIFFLRAGVTYGIMNYEFRPSAGTGIRLLFGGVYVMLDYAFLREAQKGMYEYNHRITLSCEF